MPLHFLPPRLLTVQRAVMTEEQSVVSSETLVDATELVLAVKANTIYELGGFLLVQGETGNSQINVGWTVPTNATLWWNFDAISTGASSLQSSVYRTAKGEGDASPAVCLSSEDAFYPVRGTLTVGATAGNLQLQFAQNSSSANATKLLAGSEIVLRELA